MATKRHQSRTRFEVALEADKGPKGIGAEDVHVEWVLIGANGGVPLQNDGRVKLGDFLDGVCVVCDRAVAAETVQPLACFVTVDLPILEFAGERVVVAYQPCILAATVTAAGSMISLSPPSRGALEQLLTRAFKNAGGRPVSARLTFKGSCIRAAESSSLSLDGGEVAEFKQALPTVTDVRFLTGNGRHGGDFEMWFWLVPELEGATDTGVEEPASPPDQNPADPDQPTDPVDVETAEERQEKVAAPTGMKKDEVDEPTGPSDFETAEERLEKIATTTRMKKQEIDEPIGPSDFETAEQVLEKIAGGSGLKKDEEPVVPDDIETAEEELEKRSTKPERAGDESGPSGVEPAGSSATCSVSLEERVASLERALAQVRHFITPDLRPDRSRGVLRRELDLGQSESGPTTQDGSQGSNGGSPGGP